VAARHGVSDVTDRSLCLGYTDDKARAKGGIGFRESGGCGGKK
jgi:hypothetical protein